MYVQMDFEICTLSRSYYQISIIREIAPTCKNKIIFSFFKYNWNVLNQLILLHRFKKMVVACKKYT